MNDFTAWMPKTIGNTLGNLLSQFAFLSRRCRFAGKIHEKPCASAQETQVGALPQASVTARSPTAITSASPTARSPARAPLPHATRSRQVAPLETTQKKPAQAAGPYARHSVAACITTALMCGLPDTHEQRRRRRPLAPKPSAGSNPPPPQLNRNRMHHTAGTLPTLPVSEPLATLSFFCPYLFN